MSSLFNNAPSPEPGKIAAPEPAPLKPSVLPAMKPVKGPRAVWAVSLLLIAILGGGLAYYFRPRPDLKAGNGGPIIAVPVTFVTMADLTRTIRISGTVSAKNFASLMAPRILGSRSNINRGGMGGGGLGGNGGGDFNLVLVHLAPAGARVRKDDVVAQFDPTNQLLRLDDYKDAVIQMNNNIKKMIANMAATKEAHDQTTRAARAAWDQARLDLAKAPVQSKIDAENAKLTAEATEATYKQLVFEDSLVMDQQAASIRVTELTKSQADIELQRADGNVKKMEIHTPMDGIAVMGSIIRNGEFGQVREGDQINAGQPFLTIVDPSSMVLDATVNQVDAENLRLGMKAIVHLDGYPELALPGVVEGIGAMATTSAFRANYVSSIPVRLRIERSDARVIPDLTGSADVILGQAAGALVVPRAAVFEENGNSFVFVQSPQGWAKRQVEVGLKSFLQVAIQSGLQKGELVALSRPF